MEREAALRLLIKTESCFSMAVRNYFKKYEGRHNLYGEWFNCDASGGE